MNKNTNKTFIYKGYCFKPYKRIDMSFERISKHIKRSALNLHKYEGGKGWDYKKFYEASGNSEMDLFILEKTGDIYIPGDNELFLYLE